MVRSTEVAAPFRWTMLCISMALLLPYVCGGSLLVLGNHGRLSSREVWLGLIAMTAATAAVAHVALRARFDGLSIALPGALLGALAGGTWLAAIELDAGSLRPSAFPLPFLWAAPFGGVLGAATGIALIPARRALTSGPTAMFRRRAVATWLLCVVTAGPLGELLHTPGRYQAFTVSLVAIGLALAFRNGPRE